MTGLIADLLICLSGVITGWTLHRNAVARRQRKAAEQARSALDSAIEAAMRNLVARSGGWVGTQVSPADIRTGKEIHWHGPGAEPCIDYKAGFNGDVAGQTAGEWFRKDEQ